VSSLADSRVILDQAGAERLIGKGDMLLLTASSNVARRLQAPWVSEDEVHRVVEAWRRQGGRRENVIALDVPSGRGGRPADPMTTTTRSWPGARTRDPTQSGSTSMLQRKLRVGFARAGRLMDELEQEGVVAPGDGSKARKVLVTSKSTTNRLRCSSEYEDPAPARRGIATRLLSMLLGLVVAAAIVVSMQLPFTHERATFRFTAGSTSRRPRATTGVADHWERGGRHPRTRSDRVWHNSVVPIASLTKLMTAYVVLKKFPLALGGRTMHHRQRQPGPRLRTGEDADESAVIVEVGEPLCEITLLDGMLVHSAANYADISSQWWPHLPRTSSR